MFDLRKLVYASALSLFICQPVFGEPDPKPSATSESGVYQLYSALSKVDARTAYDSLPADIRSDLWKTHLRRALAEIPDLTVEQRMVILAAIGLVESGILGEDVRSLSRDRADLVDHLRQRAKTEFEPPLGYEIFANLNPTFPFAAPELGESSCGIPSHPERAPLCSCSTDSDWCDSIFNPSPVCRKGLFFCIGRVSGCGLFFLYECDGICGD